MDELRKTAEDERRRLKRELALIQEARRKESKEKDARGLAASASVEAALRDVTKLQNEVTELKGKMAAQKREVEDMRAIRDEMRAREVITARQLDDNAREKEATQGEIEELESPFHRRVDAGNLAGS